MLDELPQRHLIRFSHRIPSAQAHQPPHHSQILLYTSLSPPLRGPQSLDHLHQEVNLVEITKAQKIEQHDRLKYIFLLGSCSLAPSCLGPGSRLLISAAWSYTVRCDVWAGV